MLGDVRARMEDPSAYRAQNPAAVSSAGLHVFGLQTHDTASGVQMRPNADHSFAGYNNTTQ